MDVEQMSTHEIVCELIERQAKTNGLDFVRPAELAQLAMMLDAEKRKRAERYERFALLGRDDE